jgi:cell division septal protein FtsQ
MYERTYRSSILKKEVKSVPQAPKRFPWKRFFLILALIAILGGFVYLIKAPWLQVRDVAVTGTNVADPDEISRSVQAMLEGRNLYIFPKTSMLVLSVPRIEARLKEQFSRLSSVSINRTSAHSLLVEVQEYDGKYLWCQEGDDCSFMDENGIVFAPAPVFSGSAYIRFYGGMQEELPFTAISKEQLAYVETIINRLEAISLHPTIFTFITDHNLAVSFIHRDTEAKIYFEPTKDLDAALQTLYTGMRSPAFISQYTSKPLEYIDLRFSNKMVYKFK